MQETVQQVEVRMPTGIDGYSVTITPVDGCGRRYDTNSSMHV